MSNVDCHIFPAGESASSIVAPLTRGMVASSVAGVIMSLLYLILMAGQVEEVSFKDASLSRRRVR